MANKKYPTYTEFLLGGGSLDLTAVDIRAVLVDLADYAYSDAHDFLADVPSGARVAVSGAMTGKTKAGGVFDCNDFSFTAVTGDPSEAIIFYYHTGSDATARLLCFMDTGITGIPVTPNGDDIDIIINASGVFAL